MAHLTGEAIGEHCTGAFITGVVGNKYLVITYIVVINQSETIVGNNKAFDGLGGLWFKKKSVCHAFW